MKREPLVQLPPALDSAPLRARRATCWVSTGARRRRSRRCSTSSGARCTSAHGGPSNEDAVGAAAAVQALLEAADEALAARRHRDAQLDGAVLAVAGTDTDAIAAHVRRARTEEWIVVNDVVGAWATATGAQPGVGAISGTGSNVFGVGADGQLVAGRRLGPPARRRGLGLLAGDRSRSRRRCATARPRARRPR